MTRARFLGTGFAVPDRVVTNDDLSRLMDTSDEWIRTRTGIQERRWVARGRDRRGARARGDACARSRRRDSRPATLDAIVYATSTPDHFAPGNGVYLQRLLGLGTIPSIDIRNQCSGFVYALAMADAFIRCGQFRHVLVVGAEIQSTAMDVSTRGRNTAVIFADGAGAAVLGPAEEPTAASSRSTCTATGTHAEKLWVDAPGLDVPPAGVARADRRRGATSWRWTARRSSATPWCGCRSRCAPRSPPPDTPPADLKLLVAHQANLRIAEMMQKDARSCGTTRSTTTSCGTGTPPRRRFRSRWTNACRAGRIVAGDLVALTAFGSGFLWGSAVVRW